MAGHPSRRSYVIIFVWLTVLTALEVGVVYTGLAKFALVSSLIGLALAKAGLVALYFMHLRYETRVMRRTALLPFLAPALYAFVLIAEGMWRKLT
jgi:cytochrome c oxidase subunit 4